MSTAAYVNPFLGDATITPERIDQGVDYALSPGESIKAIGDAIIRGIIPNWYSGQPLLWYQLTGGPRKGQYVYVAEQISPTVRPGQSVKAGATIATYASSGTGLETGFAQASGATLAQSTGGYKEGQLTAAGDLFSKFLEGLGAPGGTTQGRPVVGQLSPEEQANFAKAKTFSEQGKKTIEHENIASEIVDDVIGLVKPTALKFLLYTVFIFGGVALAGYGLATMLKPSPPSLREGVRKVGKAAELGAVA